MNSDSASLYEWLLKGSNKRPAPCSVFAGHENVVVYWSGGVDSTMAVIAALISCKKVRVVSIRAFTPNQDVERVVRRGLIPALERIAKELNRRISFEEIKSELPCRANSAWGQMPWWIAHAQFVPARDETGVVVGWLSTDDNAGVFDHAKAAMRVFDFCNYDDAPRVELMMPFRQYAKFELVVRLRRYLRPEELQHVIWCEAPVIVKEVVKDQVGFYSTEVLERLERGDKEPKSPGLGEAESEDLTDYNLVRNHEHGEYVERTVATHYLPCNTCGSCRGMHRVLRRDFDDNYMHPALQDYRRATLGRGLSIDEQDVEIRGYLSHVVDQHLVNLICRWPVGSDRQPANIARVMGLPSTRNFTAYTLGQLDYRPDLTSKKTFVIGRAWDAPRSRLISGVTDADVIDGVSAILLRDKYAAEFARVVDYVTDRLLFGLYHSGAIKNNGIPLAFDERALSKWRTQVHNLLCGIFPAIEHPKPTPRYKEEEPEHVND